MTSRTCRIGIHGRNRPTLEEHDYHLIRSMGAETVKMMTKPGHTDPAVYKRLKRDNPDLEIITRLDHPDINRGTHPNQGSHPPPDRYANDLIPTVRSLLPYCQKFQITNEPNHDALYEGWGKTDEDARSYNAWFKLVYRQMKNEIPEASFGFPGLAVPDFKHHDRAWLDICSEAINEADWLGVHCYWQTPPQTDGKKFDESFGTCFKYYHRLFPDKILEILECGNSNSQTPGFHISDEAVAQEYVDWLQELFNYPYIGSASFFIISSPDVDWVDFSWRREDGRFKPVVERIAQMPRPNLVAPSVQLAPVAPEVTPAVVAPAAPSVGVTNYTNQDIIDAFRNAAQRMGLDNWALMEKAGVRLGPLANARQAIYSGPKLAELPGLSPDEKQKIRAMLPDSAPTGDLELSFSTPPPAPVATGFLKDNPTLAGVPLAFPRIEQLSLDLARTSSERSVIRVWNRYGWLLLMVSGVLQIEPGAAVAVAAQHFRQRGFGRQGGMRLRFEPQLFFERWGRDNEETFWQHFSFDTDRPWQQHRWRPADNADWQDIHTNQAGEWAAFDLACALNKTAALLASALGAPELLGVLHATIGYETVDQMFAAFASHERYQLLGLFDFIAGPGSASRQLAALQAGNLDVFAAFHFGVNQAARYSTTLQQVYNAYYQRLVSLV
ncbi:MAG: DUF3380 domain-containing protein [Anaerolineae bacterium]|nr:DUF3380 domain-containing protein [Anaerolineae bacterium]